MIGGMLLNVATGSGLKIFSHVVSRFLEMKRQKDMVALNASDNRIIALQSGEDKADAWSKFTRRALAFALVGTICFLVIWHSVFRPDQVYTIIIDKNSAFIWSFFFDSTSKTTIEVSAGSLIWNFVNFVEIITGFYFTKVGK